jgi:hypothetical protein
MIQDGTITEVDLAFDPAPISGWMPTGSIMEVFPRDLLYSAPFNDVPLASGTMRITGGTSSILPAGRTAHSIAVYCGGTALATGTHQWFCIIDQVTATVLAVTADDTSAAWLAQSEKTLVLASNYTPSVDTPVWIGVVVVAGTMPTLIGLEHTTLANASPINNLAPVFGGTTGNTGLNAPVALGTSITLPTTGGSTFYARVIEA